ncbi:MAG TPA: chemotaxis protein CheW [Kofleriaceae bacterium]
MTDAIDLKEFVGGFVAEADELIATANASLLEIETGNQSGALRPKAVRDLFRVLHTLKGLAGMIGIEPIVQLAHALETLVRAADRGGGKLRRGALDVSAQAVRVLADRVRAVAEQRSVAPIPNELLDAIALTDVASDTAMMPPPIAPAWDDRLSTGERQQLFQALRSGDHAYALIYRPTEHHASEGVSIATVRTALGEVGEVVKVTPRALVAPARGIAFDILILSSAPREDLARIARMPADEVVAIELPAEPVAVAEPLPESPDAPTLGRSVVRVELGRLDELQEHLSLLLVARHRLEREIAALAEHGTDVRKLREIAELQARQLRDLRGSVLRARLIRVAEVLEPLPLLVRSLSRPGYKEVRIDVDAHDVELDKAVADRLLPALLHLVRNAIDHAIEPIEEREARGKPRVGTLRVAVTELSGNSIEVAVSDDGRGVDRAAVARRSEREISDDRMLLDVLTAPGFSTRDVTSTTSGRGFGLDIVRAVTVDQLGGELAMTTTPGAGTTFTLRIPVTIAIVDVFSFACGKHAFVVPVSAIDEIFELEPGQRVTPASLGNPRPVGLVQRRGRALPLISLAAELAIDDGATARKALVVRRGADPIAFAVDRMLGRQEVVVRPLDDELARAPGLAGAADLGDGRPTLVLDLGELGARATDRVRRPA